MGHNNDVNFIWLSPNTGHLLLSDGLDGKCKVWFVTNRCVMLTNIGHSFTVQDVTFTNNGLRFLSYGINRYVRI